jgi:hypothetical protein
VSAEQCYQKAMVLSGSDRCYQKAMVLSGSDRCYQEATGAIRKRLTSAEYLTRKTSTGRMSRGRKPKPRASAACTRGATVSFQSRPAAETPPGLAFRRNPARFSFPRKPRPVLAFRGNPARFSFPQKPRPV